MGLLGKMFSRSEAAGWTVAERHAIERRIQAEVKAAAKEAARRAARAKGGK
jgi:hypothetical protein